MNQVRGADPLRQLEGLPFVKMTGSGNDFVFLDARRVPLSVVTRPDAVRAICDRHDGVGGDGLVVLERAPEASADARDRLPRITISYFNSDGSAADLCGNATLCSASLARQWGMADTHEMELITPAGAIRARVDGELPEIDLPPVTGVRTAMPIELGSGETRAGFARAGIPHLVMLTTDADGVAVADRGPTLRWDPSTRAAGANVNWVSPRADGAWRYRTFERGVEGETLACGTGAVATAVLLREWGLADGPIRIRTSSGRDLEVRFRGDRMLGWHPSLRGEGRPTFSGVIGNLTSLNAPAI